MFDGHAYSRLLADKIMEIIKGEETGEVTAVLCAMLLALLKNEYSKEHQLSIANFIVERVKGQE